MKMHRSAIHQSSGPFNAIVLIAALGYMVDMYDMILFNVIKKESLLSLGISGQSNEIDLFNFQMGGMLLGGVVWGILGDKRGRLSVLFGSIILYSLANIANAFVTGFGQYALVRFIAGFGLAGELGAGITLVVETMRKEYRGYGTMLVVTFGALGAVLAAVIGKESGLLAGILNQAVGTSLQGWQMAYLIGGILGLVLLLLRFSAYESGLYRRMESDSVKRGDFIAIIRSKALRKRFSNAILAGVPIWYMVGVLVNHSSDIAPSLGIHGTELSSVILFTYLGFFAGDFLSGVFSQLIRSRKKVVVVCISGSAILMVLYFIPLSHEVDFFYLLCFMIGLLSGYWATLITLVSEQFGTNIRATVTTSIPNFIRGAVIPITMTFKSFMDYLTGHVVSPVVVSAILVGIGAFAMAFLSLYRMRDTYGREIDYIEEI